MPRIEIELTSCRPDGTWTWRAAGARQPKGSLEGSVLPEGAKVGDVLRAEADVDIEGILVRSTYGTVPKRAEPERLAILGSGKEEPGVTTNLRTDVTGGDRPRRGGRDDRDRPRDGQRRPGGGPGGRPDQGRPYSAGRPTQATRPDGRPSRSPDRADGPRHEARPAGDRPAGARPSGSRPPGARTAGDTSAGDRPAGARTAGDRPAGDRSASDRPAGDRPPGRDRPTVRDRSAAGERTARDGSRRDGPGRGRSGPERSDRSGPGGPVAPSRPPAKRLQPGRVYRDAVVADLSPEQRVLAEQVLRGGLPAVRQAVEEQNAKARAVGGPEIKAEALMAIAEELLPRLRGGEWRDRAEAAAASVDEISLRDLRAVVAGADVARDEEGRTLAARLREALDRRSAAEQKVWVDEIVASLDAGRVVRALRISGRPPDPGFRFPVDTAARLSEAASEALTAETTADRWAAVLEAVVASPVRRTIKPRGVPPEPGAELSKAIRLAAPRVPALAGMVGDVTAPPRPPRPRGPRPAQAPPAAGRDAAGASAVVAEPDVAAPSAVVAEPDVAAPSAVVAEPDVAAPADVAAEPDAAGASAVVAEPDVAAPADPAPSAVAAEPDVAAPVDPAAPVGAPAQLESPPPATTAAPEQAAASEAVAGLESAGATPDRPIALHEAAAPEAVPDVPEAAALVPAEPETAAPETAEPETAVADAVASADSASVPDVEKV